MATKTVRGVDERLFRRVKGRAAEKGISIGEALNAAMNEWVAEEEDAEMHLADLEPTDWGEENKTLSEDADDVLYGR